jgi:hypothetical protein
MPNPVDYFILAAAKDPLTPTLSPRGEGALLRAPNACSGAVRCSAVPSPLGEKDRMRGSWKLCNRISYDRSCHYGNPIVCPPASHCFYIPIGSTSGASMSKTRRNRGAVLGIFCGWGNVFSPQPGGPAHGQFCFESTLPATRPVICIRVIEMRGFTCSIC